ncbi:MAG: alanine racemase, partial [Anaerolineales bacterium]|nr:alanine racemase [Anaerolineales bacterium]
MTQNSFFDYKDDQLHCENVALTTIAAEVGTPVYIYSQQALYERAHAYLAAPGHAHYAVKANSNIHLLRLLASWGLGADVTSGGELYLAQQAGFAAEQIIFSGVGKSAAEIRTALKANIQALHAESAEELQLIEQIAAEMETQARIGLRLNPNINAETHPYISTGMSEHKFGIAVPTGIELFHYAQQSPHLRPVGIAAHIGSQIRDLSPFREAAELLVSIADELKSAGIIFEYIDVGGGLGIDYDHQKAL